MAHTLEEISRKYKYAFRKISNGELLRLLLDYFEHYSVKINDSREFQALGVSIGVEFKRKFLDKIQKIFPSSSPVNNYDLLDKKKRTFNMITLSVIYIILEVDYDLSDKNLPRKTFCNVVKVNRNKLCEYRSYLIKNYIDFDEVEYYGKVFEYYDKFISVLDEEYDLSLSKKYKTIELKEKIKSLFDYLIRNKIEVPEGVYEKLTLSLREACSILRTNGLDIKALFKELKYKFFTPQNVALTLIYFFKDEPEILDKKNFDINKLPKAVKTSRYALYSLYNIFQFTVQKKKNRGLSQRRYYPRETFLEDMKKELKRSYNLGLELMYKIYALTNLAPNVFAKRICAYKGITGGRTLIRLLKKYTISSSSLERIKNNLKEMEKEGCISKSDLDKAVAILERVISITPVSLKHGALVFNFKMNRRNLDGVKDVTLKEKLKTYLNDVIEGNYPKRLFDDKNIPSGSMLYFKGNPQEKLPMRTIRENLIENLIENKKATRHRAGSFYKFCETANRVYTEHNDKFGTNPKHDPVLSALILNKNIIGIEVPVWKIGAINYTGHVDLLAVLGNNLVIADYKPTETEVLRSIPQILAYAYMIKQRLGLKSFKNVLCVGFTKDVAWSFNPSILEAEVIDFINHINTTRKSPLYSKKNKGKAITELLNAVKNLLT
jgi:hypothetical protein